MFQIKTALIVAGNQKVKMNEIVFSWWNQQKVQESQCLIANDT